MTVNYQLGRTLRSWLVLALRWAVPVLILGVFLFIGHLSDAISALADVQLIWTVPLVLVGIVLPLSHAWRWCFLLERSGSRISFAGSAIVTSLASLLNYAAPGFLGAPAKAIFARDRYRIPVSGALPTLAAEQLLDALCLVLAGGFAVLVAGPAMIKVISGSVSSGQTLVFGVVLLAIVSVVVIGWYLGKRISPAFFEKARHATGMLLRSGSNSGLIVALTGARWLLDMTAVGIASLAVGLRLSVLEILLIANLSLLIGLIAPVPGGLGVREAVMATLAGAIGVSVPAILALSVLHRSALAIGLPLVLGGGRILEWSRR